MRLCDIVMLCWPLMLLLWVLLMFCHLLSCLVAADHQYATGSNFQRLCGHLYMVWPLIIGSVICSQIMKHHQDTKPHGTAKRYILQHRTHRSFWAEAICCCWRRV